MNRDQKAATIDALATEFAEVDTVIALDFRGMTVGDAAELRAKLRDADAVMRVVKNSLTERAAAQAGVEGLTPLLQGPTALTFVRGDAALAAKTIADAARATKLLPFKGAVMGGSEFSAEQVQALSRLPSRQVLYGQLVGVVAAPVSGLVRTMNALIGGLAVALGQVRDQMPADAAPPAPQPEAAAEPPAATEPDAAGTPDAGPEPDPAAEAEAGASGEPAADTDDQSAPDDNQAEESEEQPQAAGDDDTEATKEA